jgi:hypothetical protein
MQKSQRINKHISYKLHNLTWWFCKQMVLSIKALMKINSMNLTKSLQMNKN